MGLMWFFFDAEEFIFDQQRDKDYWFLGSRAFARAYATEKRDYSYKWGILLDMVGDKHLELYQEKNSYNWEDTRPLVKEIWGIAKELGVREFKPYRVHEIRDDHVPLHDEGGIPVIDIIDFDYPRRGTRVNYWHTTKDVLENCSGESLAKVSWVVLEWLKRMEDDGS